MDVTYCEQAKRLVDAAVQAYGWIDVMINNAGLMPQSPLERLKIDDWTIDRDSSSKHRVIARTISTY